MCYYCILKICALILFRNRLQWQCCGCSPEDAFSLQDVVCRRPMPAQRAPEREEATSFLAPTTQRSSVPRGALPARISPIQKLIEAPTMPGELKSVLRFKKLTEHAFTPSKGSKFAAGFDLCRWALCLCPSVEPQYIKVGL